VAKNTIVLKNYSNVFEERIAAGTITPGELCEFVSGADTVQRHSTDHGNVCPNMVATEDELQGNGIDDDYSAAARVFLWLLNTGDQFYGLLANGESVVISDKLVSAGNGKLKKLVPDDSGGIQTENIVATALEAVDMSDSSAADPTGRIECVAE